MVDSLEEDLGAPVPLTYAERDVTHLIEDPEARQARINEVCPD